MNTDLSFQMQSLNGRNALILYECESCIGNLAIVRLSGWESCTQIMDRAALQTQAFRQVSSIKRARVSAEIGTARWHIGLKVLACLACPKNLCVWPSSKYPKICNLTDRTLTATKGHLGFKHLRDSTQSLSFAKAAKGIETERSDYNWVVSVR